MKTKQAKPRQGVELFPVSFLDGFHLFFLWKARLLSPCPFFFITIFSGMRGRRTFTATFCPFNHGWWCVPVVQQHGVLGCHPWRVCCKQSVNRCVSPCDIWLRAASPSLSDPGTVGDALIYITDFSQQKPCITLYVGPNLPTPPIIVSVSQCGNPQQLKLALFPMQELHHKAAVCAMAAIVQRQHTTAR